VENWHKDASRFTVLNTSLEAPIHEMADYLTPVETFFVCNAGATVRVSAEDWRLRIFGDAVEREVELRFADVSALPRKTVRAYIECAGNQRTLFDKVMGVSLERESVGEDTKWTLGGFGMGEWRGPVLAHVLRRAGVKASAAWVAPCGLDVDNPEGPIVVPMPASKALHEDTLLALEMNGAPLPPDHGFPARVLVPGWVGTYSVKWVAAIDVSAQRIPAYRTDEYYVMRNPAGVPIATLTRQNIKSALALPWPATLRAGRNRIHGFARAPEELVARVEWSDDGGREWREAEIVSPNEKYGLVRFAFDWEAAPGAHQLRTRAWDAAGNTQPDAIPFNPGGFLYNAVIPHPVTVAAAG
jgi:DMSO/TMAO reductase YedYZ molybdopterin-dependent catalytic subunit